MTSRPQLSENARLEATAERLRGERSRLRQQLAVALAADQTSREALASMTSAMGTGPSPPRRRLHNHRIR